MYPKDILFALLCLKKPVVQHSSSNALPTDSAEEPDRGGEATVDTRLQWQTNETLPLQIFERNDQRYAGIVHAHILTSDQATNHQLG